MSPVRRPRISAFARAVEDRAIATPRAEVPCMDSSFRLARRYGRHVCGPAGDVRSCTAESRLGRSLACRLLGSGGARALESDDGRGHRGDRRPHDSHRRQVARGLCVLQLPRLRSRARDHRGGSRLSRPVGNASELVAPAGQPGPLRANRRAARQAARRRGCSRPADDHAHSLLRDPGVGRRRLGVRRPAGSQDDLRGCGARFAPRGEAVPLRARGRRRPRAATSGPTPRPRA